MLTKAKDICRSYRLSRIRNVIILKEKAEFSESDQQIFERMITYGPQFQYLASESIAVVYLTENGKRMFHNFYVHRPIVDKVEGNLYYFKCSYNQVLHYFKRFGKHAKIISPTYLKKQMIQF